MLLLVSKKHLKLSGLILNIYYSLVCDQIFKFSSVTILIVNKLIKTNKIKVFQLYSLQSNLKEKRL